jgi:sugar (pentulose or hexulose) kinase
LRSIVEGLACELARHLGYFSDAGLPARRLVMCGVAAASRVTPQIVADVTGQQVTCVDEPAVSAFGASLIGRALLEEDANLGQLAKELAPATRTVMPGENAAEYGRLLEEYLDPFGPTAG